MQNLTLRLALALLAASLIPTFAHAQEPTATSTTQSTAPYGNCPAPGTPGVHVCWPGSGEIQSPVQIIASATGGDGTVNHIELWVDGKKTDQSAGNLFDKAVQLSSVTHRVVLVEVDSAGSYVKSSPLSLSIVGSTLGTQCAAPSSPGVNVCSPAPGSCNLQGWTTVVATGTGASGTVARMELWYAGMKLANFAGNSINTNIFLQDFKNLTIVEVDSNGAFVKSTPTQIQFC